MTVEKKKNSLLSLCIAHAILEIVLQSWGFVFVVSGSTLTAWGLTDSIFLTYICVNVANPGK